VDGVYLSERVPVGVLESINLTERVFLLALWMA
jgi:hypothetical protein